MLNLPSQECIRNNHNHNGMFHLYHSLLYYDAFYMSQFITDPVKQTGQALISLDNK